MGAVAYKAPPMPNDPLLISVDPAESARAAASPPAFQVLPLDLTGPSPIHS